jgi:hypothetical protein
MTGCRQPEAKVVLYFRQPLFCQLQKLKDCRLKMLLLLEGLALLAMGLKDCPLASLLSLLAPCFLISLPHCLIEGLKD